MAAVVVNDLVVRYGPLEAVSGASFCVQDGEVLGLLGPNGAGKTSIVRVLVTLLRPHSGQALICGRDVTDDARAVRRLIGYVPQAISADGSLTGRENATLFAKLYGLARDERRPRIDETLALMGLSDATDTLVQDYSGGMIRRLEIACALLSTPRVLLLDEPTLGLDPAARRGVWDHLQRERTSRGMSILVTTHYMEEAEQNCDRVVVMSGGRVLAEATPATLRARADRKDATLEDVFIALTQSGSDEGRGGLREAGRARRTGRRLG
ncbi:MAG: type transport system ATP-binding protein [Acidimicrobiaceae bacterium]|jgi:ABC-2 type transport system ATP-binding protein